jgi:uncharacterized protein
MKVVGQVESLWRYPVKSMSGEELHQAFAGFAGIYGDRFYAFVSSAAPKGFPYLTAREKENMLLYRPAYRHPEHMMEPPNLAEAEALAPGVTPIYPHAADLMVDVQTPSGNLLAVDNPLLMGMLREGLRDRHELTLSRSHRAMTDCRPISLFSIQTVKQLSQELGVELDKRRFRSNIYVQLESELGFGENEFVGRTLRIGPKAMVAVVDRDPRCKMITLDPDTAEANPEVMRLVARTHDGKAGVYGAVLVEGNIRPGDTIALLE